MKFMTFRKVILPAGQAFGQVSLYPCHALACVAWRRIVAHDVAAVAAAAAAAAPSSAATITAADYSDVNAAAL